MSRANPAIVFLLALVTSGGVGPARAGGADLKHEVQKLFDLGKSIRTRLEAQKQYEHLQSRAPNDARIGYAYALILLSHHRYGDAAKVLDGVLAKAPDNLATWQTKIWLSALTKHHDQALAEIEQFVKVLPREDVAGDAEIPYLDAARFMGRLVGYLEELSRHGGRAVVPPDFAKRIAARLTAARRAAFEEGRQSVLKEIAQHLDAAETMKAEIIRAAEKLKQERLRNLERRRQKAAADFAAVKDRRKELLRAKASEIDKIDDDQREVADSFSEVETRAAGIRRELVTIGAQIAELWDLAEDPDLTPLERQRLLREAARCERARSDQRVELVGLENRMAALNVEMARLRQHRQTLETRYDRELGHINELERNLSSLDNEIITVRARRITGNTRQVRDHMARATALTNYIPLPVSLTLEKERLLDSF